MRRDRNRDRRHHDGRRANVTQWLAWVLMILTGAMNRPGGTWFHPGFAYQLEAFGDLLPITPPEGGQTLLSGTASDLVRELLPEHAWLIDFGHHSLRDLSQPERVAQLCHPDLHNDFPPLRKRPTNVFHLRPVQLHSIRGRVSERAQVRRLMEVSRLLALAEAAVSAHLAGRRSRKMSANPSLPGPDEAG